MMKKLDLAEIREKIDRIDAEIAKLFEERMNAVHDVAEYKKEKKLPIRDRAREAIVLDNCKKRVQNSAYADGLRKIMAQIIDISCRQEEEVLQSEPTKKIVVRAIDEKIAVGYQGVPGAYSHLALQKYFAGINVEEHNYTLFEDVAQAVKDGEVAYGLLPIENSSTGGITEVYDLVRRYDCHIVGEKCVKIEHNLLAYPGTSLDKIREVYSHPQGFAQCRPFFKQYPEMMQIPYFNTAKGAELVSMKKTDYMAAVAGRQAAELYGLEILAGNINANTNNYTRFFVIAGEAQEIPEADKITLVVSLKHETGSLYNLLGHFYHNGLNMLNIESRPIEGTPWEYFFHIDVSGNLHDANVKKAIAEVEGNSTYCKVLGNYVGDKI
ncbi:MAG: chorismate mutase [Acidaminococcaceae bacterium]